MRVTLHFDAVDVDTLRVILREAAKARTGFPDYNHGALAGVDPWTPVVHCDGPDCFTVVVPPCDITTTMVIASEVDLHLSGLRK